MATFTLTDLKNEVSKKYAPTVIENGSDTYTLQNLLQLPEKKRERILDLADSLNSGEDEEDDNSGLTRSIGIFKDIIVEAEENERGDELLGLVGDNTALLIELGTRYLETSQPGEAERS